MTTKICTVRILDEVNCVLVGLHPDHVGYFYEEYGRYAPYYYFNPRYKFSRWDGKIRYFQKTGKTHVYLLDDIIPRVIRLGYKIKLDDQRNGIQVTPAPLDKHFFNNVHHPVTGDPWVMRDYQVDLVNSLLADGYGVGIAGTGAGKTSMCAALALLYEQKAGFRSIIIVPDKNLTEQTLREYAHFGVDVGEYSGTKKNLKPKHVVSTWQSLKNNPQIINLFNIVIVDECHKLKGNVLTELLNVHGKDIAHRFGVTATLPKEESDLMAVHIAVGPVRYAIPSHKLIEQGHLAQLHIDIMQLSTNLQAQYADFLNDWKDTHKLDLKPENPPTYKQFKDQYFPDWPSEKNFLQLDPARLDWIKHYIEARRDLRKGNVLCLVNGVKVGQKLSDMVPDSYFVYGKDKMVVRRRVYDLFKEQDNVVVFATVHVASTGLDIPRVFNLMFVDIGKSFIRTIQSIGRGLRKAPDKESVVVSDICSDFKHSRRHMLSRTKYYREQKYPYKKHIVDYA